MMSDEANADLFEVYSAAPERPASLERVVIPIDKPHGWSSFKVIRALRKILGVRKIGHAGTLDPMATGLLICLVGRATKLMERYMVLPKTYEGVIRLGQTTPSFDAETDPTEQVPVDHLTETDLEGARRKFLGEIQQLPPMYSAVKVGGRRLYESARKGQEVERKPRTVSIESFDISRLDQTDLRFRVRCSKGTYIRSLADDFGRELGVGGHLVELRRTAIGPFTIDTVWTLEALGQAYQDSQDET